MWLIWWCKVCEHTKNSWCSKQLLRIFIYLFILWCFKHLTPIFLFILEKFVFILLYFDWDKQLFYVSLCLFSLSYNYKSRHFLFTKEQEWLMINMKHFNSIYQLNTRNWKQINLLFYPVANRPVYKNCLLPQWNTKVEKF